MPSKPKKVVKKVAAKRSKYAGWVAPPVINAKPPEPIEIKIAVDSEDLQRLEATIDRAGEIAARVEVAAKAIADDKDPNEKQLNRRVEIAIYDFSNTRISNSSYDLLASDSLNIRVEGDDCEAKVKSSMR